MQTDYAQIMPIILPTPRAGPVALANGASPDGKTTSASGLESANIDATTSDDDSADQSQNLSAFDQALAQMMMVQVPAAKPQAPSQQAPAANPIDITAALDTLQPRAVLGLSASPDVESALKAPMIAASGPADGPSRQNPQVSGVANGLPQTLPGFVDQDAAPTISAGAAIKAPLIAVTAPNETHFAPAPKATNEASPAQAANFADLAPDLTGSNAIDAMLPSLLAKPNLALAMPAPAVVEQLQANPTDLAPTPPQAAGPQTQPAAPLVIAPATAPLQATADHPLQASIIEAMGNAVSDPKARITGAVLPQTIAAPNLTNTATPQVDQAPAVQSNLAQAQSTTPAPQATTSVLANAQAGLRDSAPMSGRATPASLASGETSSAPSMASPPTAIAIAASGSTNNPNTGGAFEDAPSDLATTFALQTAQSDSEVESEIFGAPLPLEGRVSHAGLQQSSSATLSTPATAPHLAAEISRKFEGKSAQFDISLTPEGLGKVDVKITINARGEVSAAMKFDNPQAAAELKGRTAELQRALEQSGFSLSQEGISFTDGQGQGFGAQQQASQQNWQETARRTAQSRLFQDTNDLADASALRVAEASSAYSRRSNTGIDVRI